MITLSLYEIHRMNTDGIARICTFHNLVYNTGSTGDPFDLQRPFKPQIDI